MIAPALLAVLVLAAPAAPRKNSVSVVVLVKTSGVPAAWRDELRSAAETSGWKAATWVPPPAVSLDEAQQALGCPSWNEACAGQVATITGASQALLLNAVADGGGGVRITVQLVGGDGSLKGKQRELHVPSTDATSLAMARQLVAAALMDSPIALLTVDTDVPGATITLDGVDVGVTPTRKPLRVQPGAHTLVLSQEGRAPLTVPFEVKPFEVRVESHSLGSAAPPPAPAPLVGAPTVGDAPEAAPPAAGPVVGWVMAGVGGLVTLVGAGFTTAWVSGYVEATQDIARGKAANPKEKPPLSLCLGLCDDETGFGLGISHGARDAYTNGSYSAWIGGSIATVGVGAILLGTGIWLAVAGEPAPDEDAAASAPAR